MQYTKQKSYSNLNIANDKNTSMIYFVQVSTIDLFFSVVGPAGLNHTWWNYSTNETLPLLNIIHMHLQKGELC